MRGANYRTSLKQNGAQAATPDDEPIEVAMIVHY
jgi:hypothetical protein